jgi:epoxide hydrolase-like predicted phosphatase
MKPFTTLIFDIGNVIIDVDEAAPMREFQKLTGRDFSQGLKADEDKLVKAYESGQITTEEFRENLRTLLHLTLTDQQIDDAWNSILKAYPLEKFHLLKELKQRYKTLALSNTNAMHVRKFNQATLTLFGDEFASYFHRVYYSHELHLLKPGKKIYEIVLQKENLIPDETFFVDDKMANVEAAKSVGIQAYQLTHPDKLFGLLADLKII